MKITVTTPTGNIGNRLTAHLLDTGADVTVFARNPEKVEAHRKRGAKVEQGDMTDPQALARATAGSDALFLLVPPDFTTPDFYAYQKKIGEVATGVVRENKIPRVVFLSSIGAHLDSGTGPLLGLHHVENMLNDTPADVTHLRPAFFMENYLAMLEPIQHMNSVFMPVRGSVTIPMVATQDIAEVAAKRLLDESWSGKSALGIHGPEDVSFDSAAEVFTEVLGKPIKHVSAPPDQTRQALIGMGVHPNAADIMLEMYAGIDSGHITSAEPRTPDTTTPTTLETFTREVMKPALS